jgi:Zn-dependent peptidase ImmA (M78 family)
MEGPTRGRGRFSYGTNVGSRGCRVRSEVSRQSRRGRDEQDSQGSRRIGVVIRVEVKPELLGWARERAGLAEVEIEHRFPGYPGWVGGTAQPTLKQLDAFAQATHTSVGFLLLDQQPVEHLPLPDFRTIGDRPVSRPSADLLDTLYQCQQRQDWYREFARDNRENAVPLVGTLSRDLELTAAAHRLSQSVPFPADERGATWSDAFARLRDRMDDAGVLVMVSGIVGTNTHRRLDPHEFRGFAMVDDLAPLIFVNGADSKAAQLFTLVHELVHVAMGDSALDAPDLAIRAADGEELWCNQVAAEFLVPVGALRRLLDPNATIADVAQRVARLFKVSTLVALRRLFDVGWLDWSVYHRAYSDELDRVARLVDEREAEGGNFYNTQPVRVSKRLARALIASTLEGQTLYRDAFQMLGVRKQSTFDELAHRLGYV